MLFSVMCQVPRIVEDKFSEQERRRNKRKKKTDKRNNCPLLCTNILSVRRRVEKKNTDRTHRTHLNLAFTTH